jgi:regulatory associated protein of mTOR
MHAFCGCPLATHALKQERHDAGDDGRDGGAGGGGAAGAVVANAAGGLTLRWRQKEKLKTTAVALVLCLNIGVDPPDVVKVRISLYCEYSL